jgi:hypothetical protein
MALKNAIGEKPVMTPVVALTPNAGHSCQRPAVFCKNNRGLAERSNFESKGKLLYLQFPLFVVDQGFFAVSSFIFS